MIAHCNVQHSVTASQNGAKAVPASTGMEVEQATCTVAQLLSVGGGVKSLGPSFPGKCGSQVLERQGRGLPWGTV